MTFNERLGKKIKQRREKSGFKQGELAHALQISPQAVSKWENGENAPDISLLVPLSKLLNVTTDWLLGFYDMDCDTIEATVFISSVKGYTKKVQNMDEKAAAMWTNGLLYQITEAILTKDGIPVKYLGGGVLCFFTGPDHRKRSLQAAVLAKKVVAEDMGVGLHSGNIYVGTIGHSEYACKDISGKTVNIAFRILSCDSETGIVASAAVVEGSGLKNIKGKRVVNLKGINEPVEIYEIVV